MTVMTKLLTTLIAMAGIVAGCSSTSASEGARSSTAVPTTVAAACPTTSPTFTSPEIQSALQSAPLPPEVQILSETDEYNVDDPSMITVLVYLCQPGLKGDPLKDVATTVASALKTSPVGEKVHELRVSNWADRETDETARVRVEDFQTFTWSPDAVCCVNRASWKYPSED